MSDVKMNEEKPVEQEQCHFCYNGRCRGVVKDYLITAKSDKKIFYENKLACQRAIIDRPSLNFTPVDAPEVKETFAVTGIDYTKSEDYEPAICKTPAVVLTDPNAAMIERDGEYTRLVKPPLGDSTALLQRMKQEDAVSTAWNRIKLVPRVVNFDPYIPRGDE